MMMNFLLLNIVINYKIAFFIAIGIIFILVYIVINQDDKLDTYEENINSQINVLNEIYKISADSYEKILEADKNNVYEADDDIGFIYISHKNLIKTLLEFFEEE